MIFLVLLTLTLWLESACADSEEVGALILYGSKYLTVESVTYMIRSSESWLNIKNDIVFQKLFKCQVNLRGDFVMIPDSLLLDGICSCFFCEGKYVYFLTWVLNSWAFCNIQRHWRCWDTSYVLTRPMILMNCRTSGEMSLYQTQAFLIYLSRCHFVIKFA